MAAASIVRGARAEVESALSPGGRSDEGSPPREVDLKVLHKRSEPLVVSNRSLSQGLDSARRLDALEWLVQAFDALSLPDSQLFAAFGLLDRFAAMSPAPISAGPGAFALVLAAMLVALKVAGTQRDLERAKRLVVEVSGSSRPWAAVRRAELQILRRLGFRACTPTARDLLDRLLKDAVTNGSPRALDTEIWDAEARNRCADLARFLLEIGLVHDPEAIYGAGRPPLASAMAALLLSLLAVGAPRHCSEVLQEPLRLLDSSGTVVTELAEAMRNRWASEDRRYVSNGQGSAVMEKWIRRVGSWGVSPPNVGELRFLLAPTLLEPVSTKPTPAALSHEVLSALPTPARRNSVGGQEASSQASQAARPSTGGSSLSATVASGAVSAPMPAGGSSGRPQSALPPQRPPAAAAQEPAAPVWPPAGPEAEPSPMVAPPAKAVGRPGAPAVPAVPAGVADRCPEILVELTHILNMVAPKPSNPQATGSKSRPPSVAAELLVSSALRMQWPVDKRKVNQTDAAATCREAAAVLQEAAQQLLAAASSLDGGVPAAREIKPPAISADSKRRRTFGGPSPARALSPSATALVEGSTVLTAPVPQPPALGAAKVRFAGLRV